MSSYTFGMLHADVCVLVLTGNFNIFHREDRKVFFVVFIYECYCVCELDIFWYSSVDLKVILSTISVPFPVCPPSMSPESAVLKVCMLKCHLLLETL
jgi:hypothetical protein